MPFDTALFGYVVLESALYSRTFGYPFELRNLIFCSFLKSRLFSTSYTSHGYLNAKWMPLFCYTHC